MAKVAVKAGLTVKVLNTWYCTFSDSQIKQGTLWVERPGDSTVPSSNSLVIGSPWGVGGGHGVEVFQRREMVSIVEDPLGSLKKYLPTSTERYHYSTNQYRKIALF